MFAVALQKLELFVFPKLSLLFSKNLFCPLRQSDLALSQKQSTRRPSSTKAQSATMLRLREGSKEASKRERSCSMVKWFLKGRLHYSQSTEFAEKSLASMMRLQRAGVVIDELANFESEWLVSAIQHNHYFPENTAQQVKDEIAEQELEDKEPVEVISTEICIEQNLIPYVRKNGKAFLKIVS